MENLTSIFETNKLYEKANSSHNADHVQDVARNTELVSILFDWDQRTTDLLKIAALFHDIVRVPTEEIQDAQKNDDLSALVAVEKMSCRNEDGTFPSNFQERESVHNAIKLNEAKPDYYENEQIPENLTDKLHLGLYFADGIAKNGYSVAIRRSAFVSGNRLDEGDLKNYNLDYNNENDRVKAFILESVRRLGWANREDSYPKVFKPVISELFSVQKEFTIGAILSSGIDTLDQLVSLIKNTKDGSGKNYLENNIKNIGSIDDEVIRMSLESAGITDGALCNEKDNLDLKESMYRIINIFSSNYKENLDSVVQNWVPVNEYEKKIKRGVEEYNSGKWFENTKRRLLKEKHTLHKEELMPFTLGPAIRTPDYSLQNWNLSPVDEKTVVETYLAEWSEDSSLLGKVAEAAKLAFGEDYTAILHNGVGQKVSELVDKFKNKDKIKIIDIGAGPGKSAYKIWELLPDEIKNKVEFTLLDPSENSLKMAEELFRKHNIKHKIFIGNDIDFQTNEKFDLLTGVAAIHHHSQIPFEKYYNLLNDNGYAIFGDWHNSIWEHPSNVYSFLNKLDWDKKKEGLDNFLNVYPNAKESVNTKISLEDKNANDAILRFWQNVYNLTGMASPIWPLEGHRPVEKYVDGMNKGGFVVEKPQQLLKNSNLLMITVGKKELNISEP